MTASGDLVAEVRARLEAGASEQENRLLRKRLRRDALLAASCLGLPYAFGDFAGLPSAWRIFSIGMAAVLAVVFWWRYRRIGSPPPPRAVTEDEIGKIARRSARCSGCGSLVLPEAARECLQCGQLVNPLEALLTVVVFLAFVIGAAVWRVYR